MKIYDLNIEHQHNPIGVEEEMPCFSWKLQAEEQDTVQNSYRIIVSTDGEIVWDSERKMTEVSLWIPYEGSTLKPRTLYDIKIEVWDNHEGYAMERASFETGLMKEENFPGAWITHEIPEEEPGIPVFERIFQTKQKIKKARIYATACGVYEIELNGEKVSDHYFAPGWTAYQSRIMYQTYDVTDLLKTQNCISVTVGNGWYKGIIGFAYRPNFYGDRVECKLALWVQYEDGEQWVTTDSQWNVFTSYLMESEIYNGETQDFTAEKKHWGMAIEKTPENIGKITSQAYEPVRILEYIKPKELLMTPKGETVIDFGQNLTGFVKLRLPKTVNGDFTIRHAESLDQHGNFYMENLRRAKCTDRYHYTKEQEGNTVAPHFTFHGFRYIEVLGNAEPISLDDFQACVLSTDTKKTGTFHCNRQLVNQLQENIAWSEVDNFLDIPTDCPQRDERLGWTGDAQVFCATASYNRDVSLFFKKWLRDMALEQTDEYGPAHVVPNILGNIEAGAAWCDSVTFIPWILYQVYGDKRFLQEMLPSMERYMAYILNHSEENHLWQKGLQYGDWLALDGEPGSPRGATDQYYAANCYYLRSLEIVRDSANILGDEKKAEKYGKIYETVKNAFQREYFTPEGRAVSETQTGCILPLQFHLVPKENEQRMVNLLVDNIVDHKMHLTTGFMGTSYLCPVLSEYGRHDIATQIFLEEECPSWLYAVKMGATTIWERWDSILPDGSFNSNGMNSLNHYANGSIGDWMYRQIAGIRPLEPGYKKIHICPTLTKGIEQMEATFESVYGMISLKYSCFNHHFVLDIEIPCNTTAVLELPEKKERVEVGSGRYHYEYEVNIDLHIVKYNQYSLVCNIVTQETAKKMLEEHAPETLHSPILGVLWEMPVFRLKSLMPAGAEELIEKIINALNQEVEDGAVSA